MDVRPIMNCKELFRSTLTLMEICNELHGDLNKCTAMVLKGKTNADFDLYIMEFKRRKTRFWQPHFLLPPTPSLCNLKYVNWLILYGFNLWLVDWLIDLTVNCWVSFLELVPLILMIPEEANHVTNKGLTVIKGKLIKYDSLLINYIRNTKKLGSSCYNYEIHVKVQLIWILKSVRSLVNVFKDNCIRFVSCLVERQGRSTLSEVVLTLALDVSAKVPDKADYRHATLQLKHSCVIQ